MSDRKPYVWQMIREAIEALGGKTTNVAVRDWILSHYPGTNVSTIQCQIIICTVNHTSRIHYPENNKPRPCTSQYDFLYRPDRGQLELYNPAVHGQWEIAELDDGSLVVRPSEAAERQPATVAQDDNGFAAEIHLRDYLARHLEQIEPGLRLYVTEDGTDGVEFMTDVGRIDILTVDVQGRFVVVELKVARGPDSACGQLLRYMGWVRRHLAEGHTVRGIIIAQRISDKIRYALADVEGVQLLEYELALSLRPVPSLDGNEN